MPAPARPTQSSDEEGTLRPFRAGLWFGGFNALTWIIGLGTPMVLLAQQLGANAFQVGLASSFVFLTLPIQVLSTGSLARLGYRRQMVMGWGVRALFLLLPLGLALLAPEHPVPWMAQLFVASVFGFCFFRAFGVAAQVPWLAAILPVGLRGRYFATDGSITSTVGVVTLLLCSALFARFPGWPAYAVVYAMAVGGAALAIASLRGLPSAPAPAPVPMRTLHREVRRLFLDPGPFRFYLGLSLLGALVTSSVAAFTTYYLKVEAGLPASRILAFTAAQFGGQIVGGASIRRVIDRLPLRRLFQLAALGFGAVELFWLAYLGRGEGLAGGLPLAYFVFGAAAGIANSAHATMLPELSPEERRPLSIAVFTAVQGLLSGLSPMIWGLVLREPGPGPGLDVSRFALFFAFGVGCHAVAIALFTRLRETRRLAPG